ncbi:methyltransferase family protein [Litoreibacter ponti]|uniref:Methyltransferase family protein n=1 Tax=Litoreibacter ponti TaxID=1510457 RepID=A0A2T6BNT7_9RHOB|nr:methyltransferase domain-containing protein [Litoreibacter ponti]PTX57731.1 methyltransferase family protein [Litoreibacter ponti]
MTMYDSVPDIACRYERYDPKTLQPENDSTFVRLIETGWTEETFQGKSVLDIGCNSGALSLFAHSLGASKIQSVDVMPEFTEFFSDVVSSHKLPISVEKIGLNALSPETNNADVVLCMEVLHWIVHQGGTLPESIAHLASLTNETLFIETPWDIDEPSIANRKGYPTENYDIELIIRGLAKHFKTVKIERFMTYFGEMENSKRVLISATDKYAQSLPLQHWTNANQSGISLSRGVNQSSLITTSKGPKVLKSIPKNSAFVRLGDGDVEKLGQFLTKRVSNSVIVSPERIDGAFRKKESDGETYMIFPFLGLLSDYFPKRVTPKAAKDPMGLALKLFQHFSLADDEILGPLQRVFGQLSAPRHDELPSEFVSKLEAAGLNPFLDQITQDLDDYDLGLEDGLLHNDMQNGNFILTARKADRIVDLDILRAGPAYSDIISCALHTGANEEELVSTLSEAGKTFSRQVSSFDFAFSAATSILWLRARVKQGAPLEDRPIERFISGLQLQAKLYEQMKA